MGLICSVEVTTPVFDSTGNAGDAVGTLRADSSFLFLCRLTRKQAQILSRPRISTPRPTPTPIPAFAPVLRPCFSLSISSSSAHGSPMAKTYRYVSIVLHVVLFEVKTKPGDSKGAQREEGAEVQLT